MEIRIKEICSQENVTLFCNFEIELQAIHKEKFNTIPHNLLISKDILHKSKAQGGLKNNTITASLGQAECNALRKEVHFNFSKWVVCNLRRKQFTTGQSPKSFFLGEEKKQSQKGDQVCISFKTCIFPTEDYSYLNFGV